MGNPSSGMNAYDNSNISNIDTNGASKENNVNYNDDISSSDAT